MFVMPSRPSALAQILQGFSEAAPAYLQKRKEQQSSQALANTLSQIGEDASPLEFTRLLHSDRNILPEHRASALKAYTDIQNAQSRQAAANRPRGEDLGLGTGQYTKQERGIYARYLKEQADHGEPAKPIDEFFGRTEPDGERLNARTTQPEQTVSPPIYGNPKSEPPAEENKAFKERFLPPYRGKALAEWKKKTNDANLPIFKSAADRVRGIESEAIDILQLANLNESEKLLENAHKLLIDPETNDFYASVKKLNIPNPEQQLYVKTVLGRMRGAKEVLGSQMTQGELQMYMAALPTLLNSPEGRHMIIKQMQLMEEYNMADDAALLDIYENAGTENIPAAEARKLAREQSYGKKQRIKRELRDLALGITSPEDAYFEELPNPAEFKDGDMLEDENGEPAFVLKAGAWRKV